VPLSATVAVEPDVELLVIVICPVATPAAVGVNCTWNVAFCPGSKVIGNVAPDNLKPLPVIAAVLIVKGIVPDEITLTGIDTVVFSATSPEKTPVGVCKERVDMAWSKVS